MRIEIRNQLVEMAEEKYRKFSNQLIPSEDKMLGIRLPLLRKMAKELAKGDWQKEIENKEDIYFEEIMLRGMTIGYAVKDIDELFVYLEDFIPRINNWSVCDSVLNGMKLLQKDREKTWDFIQKYLSSEKEFDVRAAVIIIMQHIMKCDKTGKTISRKRVVEMADVRNHEEEEGAYIARSLQALNKEYSQGYYASMAVAWATAEAFCIFPNHTFKILENCKMLEDTRKKALQKIIESKIPTEEVKNMLRSMK